MAHIPYANPEKEDTKALTERIVAERGSVMHLYQMLLHSPAIAEGWLGYLTAVRQKALLNGGIRELVIVRVAQINGAQYEADQHIPIALKEGISQEKIDAMEHWESADVFTPAERQALQLTDQMTKFVHVDKALIQSLTANYNEQEIVELVATIAAYNMVSRFLEALGIHSHDPR